MMLQLWYTLKHAEAQATAATADAIRAYDQCRRSGLGDPLKLDPGVHRVCLGAVQTAIAQAELVLGPNAVAQAKAALAVQQLADAAEAQAAAAKAKAQAAEAQAESQIEPSTKVTT
jgi:hypothetical protein